MLISENSIRRIVKTDGDITEDGKFVAFSTLDKKYRDNDLIYNIKEILINNKKIPKDPTISIICKRIRYIRDRFNTIKRRKNCEFEDLNEFIRWFTKRNTNANKYRRKGIPECYYCGVDERQLYIANKNIRNANKDINTSKKPSYKTYRMHVDRIKPNNAYNSKNCVFSCPICNNAKSDLISSVDYKKYFGSATSNYIGHYSNGGNSRTLDDAIKNKSDLLKYLETKAKRHKHLKRYLGDTKYVKEIKGGDYLVLGKTDNLNDRKDIQSFKIKGYTCFLACFSYAIAENVGMWANYCGKNGEGCIVNYDIKYVNKLLDKKKNNIKLIKYGEKDLDNQLKQEDYEIWFRDVLYCDNYRKNVLITHDKESIIIDGDEYRNINKTKEIKLAIKDYPWIYEKECRMVVAVRDYKNPEKYDAVKIKVNRIKNSKIIHNPSFQERRKKYSYSKLRETLNWQRDR